MDHAASTNEDKLYRDYCDCLREYNEQCGDTVGRLNDVIEGLIDMKEKHEFVSEKTQKLHDACEILVQEQTQLSNVAKDITDKLSYFTELEQLGQKLNAPSFSALSDNFPVLLSRLDECIAFIEEHSHYKESYTYLARYKQQLSKALATIRHQVTGTLKSITSSVLQQQHSTPSQAPDTSYSLFYGKFRGSAPKIKTLMHEVEQRKDKSNE
jgi:DNA repair ATPase RecN